MIDMLEQKRILIVDDEPDVLESLRELLFMCLVDSAPDFDSAKKLIKNQPRLITFFGGFWRHNEGGIKWRNIEK